MTDNKPDAILLILDDEIEKKCFEIKRKRAEKALKSFFITACVLFVIIPVMFIFAGINLTLCVSAIIFIAVSFSILTPLLLNNNSEGLIR
jgi:uncharacterized membrane protein YiaA